LPAGNPTQFSLAGAKGLGLKIREADDSWVMMGLRCYITLKAMRRLWTF
jgi:hypothetical protein